MLRTLDTKPTRDWFDTLPDHLVRTSFSTSSSSSRHATALTVVPDLIQKRYRKLRKCARRLTPKSSMAEFHKVRVRAKKLRYALEIVAPTYTKPANKMLAALHKLQSKLGTQHDADVIAHYLTQLAADPPANFTAATLFLIGRMAERNARQAAGMGQKVEKPWRKVRGRRWNAMRSRMKELRNDATPSNDKDKRIDHNGAGDGRLAVASGTSPFHNASRH